MSNKPLVLNFTHFHEFLGDIPCTVFVERKSGGYVVDEIDACDHDGGELDDHALKCIEEKAMELCLDQDIDAQDRLRDEFRERMGGN